MLQAFPESFGGGGPPAPGKKKKKKKNHVQWALMPNPSGFFPSFFLPRPHAASAFENPGIQIKMTTLQSVLLSVFDRARKARKEDALKSGRSSCVRPGSQDNRVS